MQLLTLALEVRTKTAADDNLVSLYFHITYKYRGEIKEVKIRLDRSLEYLACRQFMWNINLYL